MTRYSKTPLSRRAMVGSVLFIVVVISTALPTHADARIRVTVGLATPDFHVVVNSQDRYCHPGVVVPIERHYVVLDRHDRKIARSLARRFDCSRSLLLDMRADGYTWTEIRTVLSMPRHGGHSALYHYEQAYARHDKHDRGHHRRFARDD